VRNSGPRSVSSKRYRTPIRLALLFCFVLCGCTTFKPPKISYDDEVPPYSDLPMPADDHARPLHVPPLWTPARGGKKGEEEAKVPADRITTANDAARVEPRRAGYFNAVQVFPYSPGALYQIYASPGQITDIALEPSEQLTGSGPLAAGDTVRWIVGDTASGNGAQRRVQILVKPTRPDLKTNLVITTDRRIYLLDAIATTRAWMASVSWDYPQDRLTALKNEAEKAEAAAPAASGLSLEQLKFRYAISGDTPPWRPLRAFDDGERVYIQFPSAIAQGELPPVFVVGPQGDAELVNYRFRAPYYIVDRLFGAAELRLGGKKAQVVRITRTDIRSNGL
jgi:type IV secretion system protein TrbG